MFSTWENTWRVIWEFTCSTSIPGFWFGGNCGSSWQGSFSRGFIEIIFTFMLAVVEVWVLGNGRVLVQWYVLRCGLDWGWCCGCSCGRGDWKGFLELVLWPEGGVSAGSASYSSCSDLTSSSIFSWGVFGLSGLSIRVSSSCQDLDCQILEDFFSWIFLSLISLHLLHCVINHWLGRCVGEVAWTVWCQEF